MRRALLVLSVVGVLLAEKPLFAEASVYRVIGVSGPVEWLEPVTKQPRPLKERDELPAGSVVRTGEKAEVDLASDPHLESVLRIGPRTQVTFLSNFPLRLALDEGSLFILKEEQRYVNRDAGLSQEVRVLTRDFLVSVRQGGCVLEQSGGGTALKAFSEEVQVYPKTGGAFAQTPLAVEEGYRYTASGLQRLTFSDYEAWRDWYRRNDERRDGLAGKTH